MEYNKIYNRADNTVMVRTNGDEINVICSTEKQMDEVVKRMSTDTCLLSGYEEWDEGEDKKWIMTWRVPQEFDKLIEYN